MTETICTLCALSISVNLMIVSITAVIATMTEVRLRKLERKFVELFKEGE